MEKNRQFFDRAISVAQEKWIKDGNRKVFTSLFTQANRVNTRP